MAKRGKKYTESRKKLNGDAATDFNDAVKKTLESSFAKFDETVDVAVRLGVDPRHADHGHGPDRGVGGAAGDHGNHALRSHAARPLHRALR